MSFPQFPDDECVAVTPNVFIHKPNYEGCGYRVWFRVGVQYFRIGDVDYDDAEGAELYARMFVKALGAAVAAEREACAAIADAWANAREMRMPEPFRQLGAPDHKCSEDGWEPVHPIVTATAQGLANAIRARGGEAT